MKPQKIILLIFLIYLLANISHALYLKQTVYGDGRYYFEWLQSVFVTHQFDLTNKFSIGPALFWFPMYTLSFLVTGGSGAGFINQLTLSVAGVIYTILGLILLFRLLNKFYPVKISLLGLLSIAFCSNLFFYGSLDTVNSHALSFFVSVLFLTQILSIKRNWFFIGINLGIIGLIRPQDLIYGLLIIPVFNFSTILPFLAGFLTGLSPQLIVWQLQTGKFWVSLYQARGEGFNFIRPQLMNVLFSVKNGLFLFTPVTLIFLAGLFIKDKSKKMHKFNLYFLLVVFIQIYLVASWSTWWQGASYSGRMFVSILPLLAFGGVKLFSYLKNKFRMNETTLLVSIILPLGAINIIWSFFYLLLH